MSLCRTLKNIVKRICDRRPKIEAKIVSLAKNELLKDRVILITGGSSGIGYSIAKAFLNSGSFVIITGRNQQKLQLALEQLARETNSTRIICQVFDNIDYPKFQSAVDQINSELEKKGEKKIDGFVNNAGINSTEVFPNFTSEKYDEIMTVDLKSVIFMTQAFGKYMVANKIKGNILNINSVSCIRPNNTIYGIAKRGVLGITLGAAKSLAPFGIVVNGIAPGPVATGMMNKNINDEISLNRVLLGRYILPEEIANMAVFLVSEMGNSMIGETIFMTAGAGRLTLDDVSYDYNLN